MRKCSMPMAFVIMAGSGVVTVVSAYQFIRSLVNLIHEPHNTLNVWTMAIATPIFIYAIMMMYASLNVSRMVQLANEIRGKLDEIEKENPEFKGK